MVKLTRYEKLQKEHNAKSFKPLLDELTKCDLPTFVEKLQAIQEWDRARDDLFVWIPVLNRIDDILSSIVDKYSYKTDDFIKKPVRLVTMADDDVKLCVELCQFSCRLLYNSENRFIYSSMDVMNNLLNCPNFKVKLSAIKVLAIMGERYVVTREKIDSDNVLGSLNLKKKALNLALALPSSTTDDEGKHFSLSDLYFKEKKFPSKWSKLKYNYYTSHSGHTKKPASSHSSTQHKELSLPTPSMKRLVLTKEELQKSTIQQLYDNAMDTLPPENWFDFSLKVAIAKAFSDESNESLNLRNEIIRVKFNAIALVNTIYIPPQVSSKLFEIDPYAFNSLSEFISISETKISKEMRLDALFSLECISLKHVWCSDIVRNLGGNISHGLLFQILHYIAKILREGSSEVDEEYNVRMFYLISNLADVKSLHASMISAGLIQSLIEIVSVKKTSYKRSMASASHLLELLISDSESTSEFINNDGFNILINSITDEVNFALEHPEYGAPPKYSLVYYSISFRQLAYIRSLLKIVLKLLRTDSGDRIRNLIDSPILISIKKILENRPVFGYTLVTHALDIVQRVINSEPTIYPVLVEAGLIPHIIEHFPEYICPNPELLSLLPDLLSALCLNTDGLKKVKEHNLIQSLLGAVTNPKHAQILSWKEEATDLGASVDELARHYPELKPIILESFCSIVKELPKCINFNQKFLYDSPNGADYFYRSKTDAIEEYEEGATELSFWDVQESTSLVDCFADLFYGMTLENSVLESLPERLHFSEILSIAIMEGPPFDYTSSQTMLNFTDVLQLFDEKNKDYAFPVLMKELENQLEDIKEFLTSPLEFSYILQAKVGRDNSDIEDTLSKMSRIVTLLYLITDVYINVTSLTATRVLQILEYFEKNGFKLIKNIRLLFQKTSLEEMYIREVLPDKVITDTMPEPLGSAPPIQIHVSKPSKRELKDDYTSSKMKNTFEVRFLLSKLQSCSSIFFRCLLRLSHAKNIDIEISDRAIEVHIFSEVVSSSIAMLRSMNLNKRNLPFFLVMLNFNSYIYSFPKTTISGGGILQTIPIYLFYQMGGYKLYVDLTKELFKNISQFDNIEMIEEINYLKNTEEVLTLSCLINVLTFLNKSIQLETMENIRSIEPYYPYLDYDYNMTKSIMIPIKILSLALIFNLNNYNLLFNNEARKIPYAVFKQILTMLKNIFSDSEFDSEELLELHWDLIPPSSRKIKLLTSCGLSEDVARGYLEENDDELPQNEKPDSFSEAEWEKYQIVSKNNMWQLYPPQMLPQYKEMASTEDLTSMRKQFFDSGLQQKVFNVLPFYPKLVNAFAKTLLQIYADNHQPEEYFAQNVLEKIIKTNITDTAAISSLIHLFGIFLNERRVYEQSNGLIDQFLDYLLKSLKPDQANSIWFSKALYVYEIILAKSEVPDVVKLPNDIKLTDDLPTFFPVYRIPYEIKKQVFHTLIRVSDISNFYSALATCRILILYARDNEFGNEIIRSGILSELLKSIGVHQKSDKINFLESSFILLLRRCFETDKIVKDLISYELNKSFTTRAIGENKEKERELNGLIDEKPHVVMRNPESYTNLLCGMAKFVDFDSSDSLNTLVMKRDISGSEKDTPQDVKKSEGENYQKRTGIVHMLLSQLMAASRKDWLSEPGSKLPENKDKKLVDKVDPAKNPVCAYMMFLLKVLVELVSSYKKCKFEFLTYDRRNSYSEFPKPRSTAINFFLYELLDKTPNPEQNKYESKRREVISLLARSVLVGFIASVQDSSIKANDPKEIDPDMNFIRKCTIESLMKALKQNTSSAKLIESNVSKLDCWFKIISSMVFVQAPYLRLILDSNKIDADQYQMCKLMIEMNVPSVITECMANIEINYPFSKKLFNNAVDPFNAINSVRNSFSELFKIEINDDEDVVEEESDKEDAPNMFKNSSLGMYDVEDIEEDDDDESLIGDDEDIAFVDGEDGEYEVVFSDDDDEDDDEDGDGNSHSVDLDLVNGREDRNVSYEVAGADGIAVEIATDSSFESDYDEDMQSGEDVEEHYYSDNDDGIDVIDVDESSYSSDLDIELSDYNVDESDWESGLSDLSDSQDDEDEDEDIDSESNGFNRMNGIRRHWVTDDGVDIIESPSDDDGSTGVFQGIEHVFHNEDQPLFRVQGGRSNSRHNNRVLNRNFGHSSFGPPSLTLLNVGRRHQSNLINPLGPSGLEEVENDISDQLISVGSGLRPRNEPHHFAGVLFSGESFDERTPDGIVLKPSVSRWKDIFDMFYDSKWYVKNIIPSIISRTYHGSLGNSKKKNTTEPKIKKHGVKRTHYEVLPAEDESSNSEEILSDDIDDDSNASENELVEGERSGDTENSVNRAAENAVAPEPVFVTINGTQVNIAGTDIDPDFLNALPEDMREEVFTQHIRERRAEALYNDLDSREIDSTFLDAIPQNMRDEILEQEAAESRVSSMIRTINNNVRSTLQDSASISNTAIMEDNSLVNEEENENDNSTSHEDNKTDVEKRKSSRMYFSPLVDRAGVAALMKSVFISQPYVQREAYHELFYRLCSSKQTRSDIINMLLIILTEGIIDHHSLEKVYNLISSRALGIQAKPQVSHQTTRHLPPDCTPLVVANQSIEILQSLIEADSRLKFYFITEHDNLSLSKPQFKNKKDIFSKNMKWPIKNLLIMLNRKIITDETVLMDLLTRVLQVCTKPILTLNKPIDEKNASRKKFQIPEFDIDELKMIVSIIKLESCNTKVFQQTLNIMYNLSAVSDAVNVFTEELISLALETVDALVPDLNKLSDNQIEVSNGNEINSELIQKFTIPSSDQAKLLKILTAVDYLHTHKTKEDAIDVLKLMSLYNRMQLGKLWSSLSQCLTKLEEQKVTRTSATILLPLIESLMVVCKHSKSLHDGSKSAILKLEEENKLDFDSLPVESLFFPFTDLHRKLLNQMIRSNPKLMSGPFSLLVKNPKVLDFDNKRYYFVAKIRSESQEHPKLSITVRRDQVFLDSYRSLFFKSNEEIKNSKLEIVFKGESGVDAGGLTREWYQVLSRQMFNPDYALFIPVASDTTTFRPNRTSGINPEHCSFFKFIGMIIGKAIRDQCYLDCHFSREVYKNILGKSVSLKDMESLDLDYYKSLIWIIENDITDIIEETFSVETDDYGEHKIIDLIKDGRNIAVTEENKQEYVQKIVEYKLQTSVNEQMENFLQGFYALIPKDLISIFDEQELELLISGLPDIDVDDWKSNSTYVNYTSSCKQINYFWRAVKSFDQEERVKLLQFVTGTSKVPLNGFKELAGVNGVCKFSIHKDYGAIDRLPTSHTCFNQLDLPAYNSYETLRRFLLLAISEGYEGFGIA
ncbi:hypothetical protein Kpol_1023p70 [Vanderwaltozyma polyspora DSM 70294]|uniref:HECT-type E3 ubiquitin transferase n=1 Tax=Vanderwaltozyma polyspora (strain ATCC 22028 / DSM 70294 / BCRC 21397 / CBS 2163 / NBRC 10782 / NRRL Y-8283 / UCD 57-17) TaxID=436907 RepID=A7TFU3_VANPO|nr:uncharacterized protein Kpol_1023p70 [Vanderwaltozyma polyspora DSM 70294]EDO18901.1 hypothetical protein Kpol_1023p70 [Vanderwaltozyma polyspora DSM 70294]